MTVLRCTQYSSIFINIHQYLSIFINILHFCTFCRFSKVVAPAHLVALLGWATRQIVSCLSGWAQDAQLAMKRVWKESLSACLPRKHRENEWKLCSTPLEYLYYWSLVLSIGFPPNKIRNQVGILRRSPEKRCKASANIRLAVSVAAAANVF